ncbi:class I SAM-dependent RNA methyltransferase [Frigoribacterium sp. CFBP 13729]|jgi:tRNA/tmRNA/rRNA uracil-C5-methylase (TrmA/RlmC/RlmD family)|uniref:class I SAM-dependent RNA methyltransferase n=1 Tax=unclassified Frigoribacterium TaxID=2627005 RepID=UPI001780D9EA|nr:MULTISPECIES: TRAM domain-containing protein [unclassified Frigoribacterium]MBD8584965.1 class I SAM-dependent RNA methyltransferase [Frigoribacterium sp. CFBP 8766]MBD8609723.1 class I SAM-dependent RNA methyltransferase [Frigoribacterium sp. CFBP 13729]
MGDMLGREVELDVTGIAHGGISVARLDGRVVFVSDTLPGEKVLARVTDDRKKSFWRAETVSVVEASPHRREHVWSAASVDRAPEDRAGGAEFGHIELGHQRELKSQVVRDALTRTGGLPDEQATVSVEALPGDDERGGTGWRTRVRLHLDAEGRPGQYAARSHRVVRVADLPLATPEVAEAAPLADAFPGEEHVDVLAPSTGGARLIIGGQAPSTVTEVVGDRTFQLDDGGFWQVHRHAAATLTAAVQQMVDAERFEPGAANLDLYGGVGLLAAAVGDAFGSRVRITSVESDERATEHASENLADWLGASAVTGRVDRWVRQAAAQATSAERDRFRSATVVLDPPRSGAGRPVVDGIAQLTPAQVVYVACDPVALARDLALFRDHGYDVDAIRAFDLFPSTHHVETVVRLLRR